MIRNQVDYIYDRLDFLKGMLEKIRKSCTHEEEVIANYSWRPGSIEKAYLCAKCDTYLRPYTHIETEVTPGWSISRFSK